MIKDCPFCGGNIKKLCFNYGVNSSKWGAAECPYCEAQAPCVRTAYDESENAPWHEEAAREWNKRTTESSLTEDSIMRCPQCDGEIGIPEVAVANLIAYHKSLVVKTECCGRGVVLNHATAWTVELYEGSSKEDDWGDTFKLKGEKIV